MQGPLSQEQMDYESNWPMPHVHVGDIVCWFARFNDQTTPACARVTRVSSRSIECRVDHGPESQYTFDVLHKDDPRLHRNANMQRNGSWDYSPMEHRLLALEDWQASMQREASATMLTTFDGTPIRTSKEFAATVVATGLGSSSPQAAPAKGKRNVSAEARQRAGDRLRRLNAERRQKSQQEKAANAMESVSQ